MIDRLMTAAEQLSDAFDGSTSAIPRDPLAANVLAQLTNIPIRVAANAICGRPVATTPYLRICRAIKFDPAPTLRFESSRGGDFDFALLAMGLKMRCRLNGHTERTAAAAMGLGASTVCRALRGEYTGIEVVLQICRYIGAHPFGYMRHLSKQ